MKKEELRKALSKDDVKAILQASIDDLNAYRSKRKGVGSRLQTARTTASATPIKTENHEPQINWKHPDRWAPAVWVRAVVLLAQHTPLWIDSGSPGALQRHELHDSSPKSSTKRAKAGKRVLELVRYLANALSPDKPELQQLLDVIEFLKTDLFPKWDKFCVKFLKKEKTFQFSPAYLLAATDPLDDFIKKERSGKFAKDAGWDTKSTDKPTIVPTAWEL